MQRLDPPVRAGGSVIGEHSREAAHQVVVIGARSAGSRSESAHGEAARKPDAMRSREMIEQIEGRAELLPFVAAGYELPIGWCFPERGKRERQQHLRGRDARGMAASIRQQGGTIVFLGTQAETRATQSGAAR